MILSLTLSLISLGIITGFVSYRAWQIRTGEISVLEHHLGLDKKHGFEKIKGLVAYKSKKAGHWVIMSILKGWVVTSHVVEKKAVKLKNAFTTAQKTHAPEDTKKEPSFFLHTISEYKAKVKKFRDKLKENDKEEEEQEFTI